ncbi:hypothetical protein [Novipirellula sp.]|uniref:hypothetical protein n=1 Tax=Novipirellula sp. TaxID=2795430 RepID=UPI00356A28C9
MLKDLRNSIRILLCRDISGLLDQAESRVVSSSSDRKFVFIAAMPKSGSTYLSKKLAEYFDSEWGHISDLPGGCEFDLYRPSLITKGNVDLVVQQHTLGTEGNVEYLQRYRAHVIVTFRRLDDTLLSFRRHLLTESLRWPFVKVNPDFRQWSVERQLDFLVDFVAPWLVNFYATWKSVQREGILGKSLMFLNFASLKHDETETLASLVRWITDADPEMSRIKQLVNEERDIYRKSNATRLDEPNFTEEQRQKLARLLTYVVRDDCSSFWPYNEGNC